MSSPAATEPSSPAPSSSRRAVVLLGWISFLNDLGSEVLSRFLPIYVASVLGAPMKAIALIEGVADGTATILKPISGRLSDRLRRRKLFVTTGYGLSAVSRPFLALCTGWIGIAVLRFFDRLGKGVRTAPRDALIADYGTSRDHGRHFGINRALDTLGGLIGIILFALWALAYGKQTLSSSDWITLTIFSSIPGFLACLLAFFGIREPHRHRLATAPIALDTPLSMPLKRFLVVMGIFTLAASSDAFIFIRMQQMGYTLGEISVAIMFFNLVSAATAIPAAQLSDRFGRKALMIAGWSVYAIVYFLLSYPALCQSRPILALILACYGLFYGFTESVERAWVADLSSPEERGKAYGWFGFVVGAMTLPANLLFGFLWDRWGSDLPFLVTSVIAAFSILCLYVAFPPKKSTFITQ